MTESVASKILSRLGAFCEQLKAGKPPRRTIICHPDNEQWLLEKLRATLEREGYTVDEFNDLYRVKLCEWAPRVDGDGDRVMYDLDLSGYGDAIRES